MRQLLRKSIILNLLLLGAVLCSQAQQLTILDSGRACSLRGLSVVNAATFWASGSQGTMLHSLDGGKTLRWQTLKGYESRDFRSVVALTAGTALVMAVANPALILKTTDTGRTWKTVYEKQLPGIFLDAMAFEDQEHGYCVGDPIDGRFWILETLDGGNTWAEYPLLQRPEAEKGEALFASSGSNIQFVNQPDYDWGFVTGGLKSRLILMGKDITVPNKTITLGIQQGLETTGANSWAVDGSNWMVVGGNFSKPMQDSSNGCISTTAGATWKTLPETLGYKSSIAIWQKGHISCGTSGVAVCNREGTAWRQVSKLGFHACAAAPKGNVVYFVGPRGRVGKMVL